MIYIVITILAIVVYLVIQHFIFKKWEREMIKSINNILLVLKSFFLVTLVDKLDNIENDDIDNENNDNLNI